MASGLLDAIIPKVRRLTRAPSQAQLSDADITEYVNTFVLYDFPEHLRTFNFHEQFSFQCNPFQDTYPTDIIDPTFISNPLWNFKNLYLTINPPVYIAGFQQQYTQSRQQFYAIYPQVRSIASIGQFGDGITTTFTGTVNTQQAIVAPGQVTNASLLQNNVLFDSIATDTTGLSMVDVPIVDQVTGLNTAYGNLYSPAQVPSVPPTNANPPDPNNNINYATGAFTVTFENSLGNPTAPAANAPINSQTVQVQLARPQMMLYYDNAITIRPVPDQPYTINFEVYKRPFELNVNNPQPALEEYWQFIAYGASRKILQDRIDNETLALIEPEFREQMRLILRRTLVQNSTQRVSTIYTENVAGGNAYGWGFGGQF